MSKVTMVRYFVDCVDGNLYQPEDDIGDAVPWLIIRLIVRAPHFATRVSGDEALVRVEHRALQTLTRAVIRKNEDVFDAPAGADGLGSARVIPGFINALAEAIRADICREDEIALDSIELYGSWPVYDAELYRSDSKLNADLENQLNLR